MPVSAKSRGEKSKRALKLRPKRDKALKPGQGAVASAVASDGIEAIQVQVTISGCRDCSQQMVALSRDGVPAVVAKRIHDAVQGRASTGAIAVRDLSVPANSLACARYECPAYTWNLNAGKFCYGSSCDTTCCAPVTCAQTLCSPPLVPNADNSAKTCSSEAECGDTCCELPCTVFKCRGGSCPKEDSWRLFASASNGQETCCDEADCCDAPIAPCIACMKCLTTREYCKRALYPWIHRRLSEDGDRNSTVAAGQPVPRWQLEGLTSAGWPAGPLLPGMDAAAARRLEWFANAAPAELQLQQTQAESWRERWNDVVMTAKATSHGLHGCEEVVVGVCRYTFRSLFALHREAGKPAQPVRAVRVLTDTHHAVSCGDDSKCWVWEIHSSRPVQAFTDHTGPVYSVSVLHDATYILSAGRGRDGKGEAYIWDWRFGFQFKDLRSFCSGGFYMSSAEMDAWRLVALGCTNNFTTLTDFKTGNFVRLPYSARTVQEISDSVQGRVHAYERTILDGAERLAVRLAGEGRRVVTDIILAANPEISRAADAMGNLHNFLYCNDFGPVNAITYVPSRLRLCTGHEDGLVRYWSAETGMLLMVMQGHQGPVNALAASATEQAVFSAGEDGTVRLWDLATGREAALLYQASAGPALCLALLPGGAELAVGSADGGLRLWDIRTATLRCSIQTGGGPVFGLAVNPSNPAGQILAAGGDGYVRVFDPR